VFVSESGVVCEWVIGNKTIEPERRLSKNRIRKACLGIDSSLLAYTTDSESVTIVKTESMKPVASIQLPIGGVSSIDISSDNRVLATANDYGSIDIWDVNGGKSIKELKTGGLRPQLCFSAHSKIIGVAVSDGKRPAQCKLLSWHLEHEQQNWRVVMDRQGELGGMVMAPDKPVAYCIIDESIVAIALDTGE
jgi:WD40 repeat protein